MLCFRKFPVAKKFMDKRGGGEYQDFPSKIRRLTVPKNFVGEPFLVSENFWHRKMLRIRERRGIVIFRQKFAVSQYRKIS